MTNLDELEDLLRKGEKEKAYELIKEDKFKSISAEIFMNEGIYFGIIEEYDLSIAYLELAEKIAINDNIKRVAREKLALVYFNRGTTYSKLKQHEKAIKDYNKALKLNPNLVDAYNNRGNAYSDLKQHKKAIEDYNKVIERNPKYAEAHYNRGVVYFRLKQHKKAIEDYNKVIELNPKYAKAYANCGISYLQTNENLDIAIEDFKHARDLFEGKDKEGMLGFVEWAKARKEMNMKNWNDFRKRMNETKEIFEKINDPLSHSIDALIKFSSLDEELDNALNIPDPIKALDEIENALKNIPEVEGLINPERTIFSARILSFVIMSEFIGSVKRIDENTNLKMVKVKLTELFENSKVVEEAFESVNFAKGKTAIVDIQDIISSVKQEIEKIEWAANKKQKTLEILKKYWSMLSSAIKVMNGILTRETENNILRREIKSEIEAGFAETIEEIHKAKEEILEKIHETENILLQKDAVNARYRIEIKAPLISSLSPISPKIIIDIPMGNLTKEQIEEKAEEIAYKIQYLKSKVKEEFLEAIKHIPVIGDKLLRRLKKTKN